MTDRSASRDGIAEYGVDIYRNDFNINPPRLLARRSDAP